ncbi:sensor histidine kinase [Staphylococcus aureus]|uniref:sensor histidine kinase n=1 Tax=Staphylococcus aureus TaxID=1280 RepID=UPI0023E36402|nr:sensor histidine kinase [Staphylococcus aureus]MDF4032527.1 ATP-binding protein [Staphylococcus aureus]MDU0229381.1 ATP-binding protein [Staphylococcus aureus]
MFKTLYARIAIYSITVILFSALISFVLTNVYYHYNLKASNDAKIMKTLKEARQYEQSAKPTHIQQYFKHLGQMNYQIMTVDQKGHKTFYGEPFREDTLSQNAINNVLNNKDYHGIKDKPFAVFMRPDIGETFSEFRTFLAVLLMLLLFISISLVIASTYSIIRPVKKLKLATERLIDGDFETPIKQTRKDEIGTLQYHFNKMRESLGQVDQMRQHFVQNVSHEIKTPLTHIHHLLSELQQTSDKTLRQQYINDIYTITTQLSGLTTELLLLSELDNHQHLLFDDKIQVDQLIKDIIRHEQFAADEKSLIILADLESINFLGNQRLLHQALSNLLINAIKYTDVGGAIDIALQHSHNNIIFTISNDGSPISPQAEARLFERFYKVSKHDNSNGLGLAITKSIIELHHGTIQFTQSNEYVTTFTITLPNNSH